MLALAQYEAGVCSCGFHSSLTSDPSNHFTFEDRKCPVCAGVAQYGRIQYAADEKKREQRGDKVPPATPEPSDGRMTYVRRMSPDELSERRQPRARPSGPTTMANSADSAANPSSP